MDPLKSFPSDDFFGFFDDDEDTWVENAPYDLEIGIGRLPVTTEAEAKAVVDKLIAYDNISNTLGDWKNQILFVADDGDNNLHQRQADQLAAFIDQNTKGLIANRLFMDAFPQELTSQGKRSPIMRNKLTEEVLKGNLIVNYTGHGSEMLWASEDILNVSQIKTWNNFNRLALFITATCEFGRFDNPILVSGAEYAITHPQGGALALLTTTRPVFADENFIVNKAVYNALLNKTGLRLGDVIKNSKNTIENNVNNRGFTLLGDPAAKLSFPSQRIEVTKVNQQTTNTVAVLKSLGEVEIEGQVKQGAQVLKDFQGLVYVKLFEKPSTRLTLGDEGSNTVMSYAEYTNLLFQGSASVVDGNFTFTAFIPKDINYELGTGKLTLYAVNNEKNQDASGSFSRFMIGKTKENAQTDTQPPTLEVSIGGNPVKKGQVLPSSSIWKIRVKDNSSITISGIGVGRNFEAVLDGTTQYVLNNDFQFDQNSYQAGQALLNLKNLSEGEHTMSIKVWDAFNNSTEETFTFRVVKEKAAVEKVIAFPNPFNEKVSFSVEQNQQDAVLDIVLQIFDNIGRRVYTRQKQILSEGKSVKGLEWNGTNQAGSPVNSGIYFYQILVGDSEAYSGKVLVVR